MKYLLLLLLLVSVRSFSQTPSKLPVSAVVLTQPVVPAAETKMSEKDYYKMMYEQAAAAAVNANTLTQWTLASVASVIVLVIGSQIFFNYKLSERELSAVRSDMQAQISEAQTALLRRMSEISQANLIVLETRTQAIDNQIRASTTRELDTYKQELNQQELSWRREFIGLSKRLIHVDHEFMLLEAQKELYKGRAYLPCRFT